MLPAALTAILASAVTVAAAPQLQSNTDDGGGFSISEQCRLLARNKRFNEKICNQVGQTCRESGKRGGDLWQCMHETRREPEAKYRCGRIAYVNIDPELCRNEYMTCYNKENGELTETEVEDCAREKLGLGGFPKGTDLKTMMHRVCLWDHDDLAEEDCLSRYAECYGQSWPEVGDKTIDRFPDNNPTMWKLKNECAEWFSADKGIKKFDNSIEGSIEKQ